MSIRTTQVRVADGTTVTVREPAWCVVRHEEGHALADLMHEGREIPLTVPTGNGRTEILTATLTQNPYATDPTRRAPRATVLLDGAWHSFDPDGLWLLAAGLVAHAGRLQDMASVLAGLLREVQ